MLVKVDLAVFLYFAFVDRPGVLYNVGVRHGTERSKSFNQIDKNNAVDGQRNYCTQLGVKFFLALVVNVVRVTQNVSL